MELKFFNFPDDVLKARLKTVGVTEHRFEMETAAGRESGTEWRIVDVGGSRSQVRLVLHTPTYIPPWLTHRFYTFSVVSIHTENNGCAVVSLLVSHLETWIPFFDDGVCPR